MNTITSQILAGELDSELTAIISAANARRDALQLNAKTWPAKLAPNCRPTYLSGVRGHLGKKKGTKWEFFPEPGTRAYERSEGRAWRISFNGFDKATQEFLKTYVS